MRGLDRKRPGRRHAAPGEDHQQARDEFHADTVAETSVYSASVAEDFTSEDLEEALRAITSTISKCEKVQPKLKQGTPQHTLLTRRIRALQIASALIQRELGALR